LVCFGGVNQIENAVLSEIFLVRIFPVPGYESNGKKLNIRQPIRILFEHSRINGTIPMFGKVFLRGVSE
jgi:hypothetical protein